MGLANGRSYNQTRRKVNKETIRNMSVVKYVINQKATIKEALVALDGNTHDWQTLFVVDNRDCMVGTLTDGDVRRGLINGAALEDRVGSIMHRDFKFVIDGQNDAQLLKKYRDNRLLK